MDYKRLALAAVVAWVVDMVYGFLVWGVMLSPELAANPAVFRPESEMNAIMPMMFLSVLIGMFALAYIYAKGYEGGGGLTEGVRFGVVAAVFVTAFTSVAIYASFNIDGRLAFIGAVATFIEMTLVGGVLGAVYRPAAQAAPAPVTA